MLKTLKYKIMIIVATLTMTVPMFLPLEASADVCSNNGNIGTGISSGIQAAAGSNAACTDSTSVTSGVENIAREVVKIFSIVVGIISVIMIIYAGFRYITSGGESGSVSNAKNTLIYAIIGLVIVVLAQLIVHFVLNASSQIGSSTGTL